MTNDCLWITLWKLRRWSRPRLVELRAFKP
nr:MAG TPA: hypothetical protein [Caudoviricetes sp.]